MYKYVLFDLDGTLTDPGEGITNSVMYALSKWNIKVDDRRELYKFIGPPLIDSFEKYYGFSEEEARQAVVFYREYFSEKGIFENKVYNDIPKLLESLVQKGLKLIVATSKPEPFSERIIKHFSLEKYFAMVCGSTMDEKRTAKAEVISYALSENNITDLSEVIMVGDREHDIIGAKKVGIDCLGVTYGYGSYDELKQAGATYIVDTVPAVLPIIL